MFAASDDEERCPVVPPDSQSELPAKLKFLNQVCVCCRRSCYQQFISQAKEVQQKQQEFRRLPAHEKARVFV